MLPDCCTMRHKDRTINALSGPTRTVTFCVSPIQVVALLIFSHIWMRLTKVHFSSCHGWHRTPYGWKERRLTLWILWQGLRGAARGSDQEVRRDRVECAWTARKEAGNKQGKNWNEHLKFPSSFPAWSDSAYPLLKHVDMCRLLPRRKIVRTWRHMSTRCFSIPNS